MSSGAGKWFNSRNGFGSDGGKNSVASPLSYLAAIKRVNERHDAPPAQIELPKAPEDGLEKNPEKIFD